MDTTEKKSTSPTTRPARYVRFTDEEYARLLEDERRADKSAQDLLKEAYFGMGPMTLLMSDEEKDRLMAQIRRIGNNVNQIARALNSGFRQGYQNEIEEVRGMLTSLLAWMSAKYGPYRRREV